MWILTIINSLAIGLLFYRINSTEELSKSLFDLIKLINKKVDLKLNPIDRTTILEKGEELPKGDFIKVNHTEQILKETQGEEIALGDIINND